MLDTGKVECYFLRLARLRPTRGLLEDSLRTVLLKAGIM